MHFSLCPANDTRACLQACDSCAQRVGGKGVNKVTHETPSRGPGPPEMPPPLTLMGQTSRSSLRPQRVSPPGASSLCPWTLNLNRGFTYLGHRTQTGSYSSHLGALEALIRKETANDSVSGLWQLCSVYGPFTALGPGGSDGAALWEGRWRQGRSRHW